MKNENQLIFEAYLNSPKQYAAILYVLDNGGLDLIPKTIQLFNAQTLKDAANMIQKHFKDEDIFQDYEDYYGKKQIVFPSSDFAFVVVGEQMEAIVVEESNPLFNILKQTHNTEPSGETYSNFWYTVVAEMRRQNELLPRNLQNYWPDELFD